MTPFEQQTIRAIGGLLVEARQARSAAIEVAKAAEELARKVAQREAQRDAQRDEAMAADFKQLSERFTKALKKLRAAGSDLKSAGSE